MSLLAFGTVLKRNFARLGRKDFYSVLGVEKNAAESEIKKAYFELAKNYHPDVNKDPGASEKFARVNEAYEVLGDLNRRKAYDAVEFGERNSEFVQDEDWMRAGNLKGEDASVTIEISFLDVVREIEKSVEFERKSVCNGCKGSKAGQNSCKTCKGSGYKTVLGVQLPCSSCKGSGSSSKRHCDLCQDLGYSSYTTTESIKIPAGINSGQTLRISNKGHQGLQSPGDLIVTIQLKPHPTFKREGQNVHSTVNISLCQAVLGDTLQIDTIYGKANLKVNPGTSSGELCKIPNHGFQYLPPEDKKKGEHVVSFKVKLPKNMGLREKGLYLQLAKEEGDLTADQPPMKFKANIK